MLLAAAVALAGCGADDGSGEATEEEGIGIVRAGSTAQFADCGDWRKGTEEQRYVTIAEIRGQLTPQSSETAESDLSDEQAYEIFQSACEAHVARCHACAASEDACERLEALCAAGVPLGERP